LAPTYRFADSELQLLEGRPSKVDVTHSPRGGEWPFLRILAIGIAIAEGQDSAQSGRGAQVRAAELRCRERRIDTRLRRVFIVAGLPEDKPSIGAATHPSNGCYRHD
jgi:hypothetical protein